MVRTGPGEPAGSVMRACARKTSARYVTGDLQTQRAGAVGGWPSRGHEPGKPA